MKPFSAIYYIKENKKRSIALIVLIATISLCYMGGLYIQTGFNANERAYEANKDFNIVYFKSDVDESNIKETLNSIENYDSVSKVFNVKYRMSVVSTCAMNIELYNRNICFKSTEDFKEYNDIVKIVPDDIALPKNNQMIISSNLAKNNKIKVGDIIKKHSDIFDNADRDYQIVGIFDSDNHYVFSVNEDNEYYTYMVLRKDVPKSEIKSARENLNNDLSWTDTKNDNVWRSTNESLLNYYYDFAGIFKLIYYVIIALISLVLVITINAIFTGAYEKRHYEFCVYNAIGFSRKDIRRKIIKEAMIINLFGIILGAVLVLLSVTLLNVLTLIPNGMELSYYENISILPTIVCDILIISIVVLNQIRKIKKYDVTEY